MEDTVCVLSLLTCQEKVKFLAVTDYSEETIVDTFGLGVSKLGSAPTYIEALHRDKLIDTKTIFLNLNPDSRWNDTDSDDPTSLIEFGQTQNEVKNYVKSATFYNHHYAVVDDPMLNRPLMAINLTAAYVFGEEFVKDSKAVVATNQ